MVGNGVCNEGAAFGSYYSDGSFTECVIARHYNGLGALFLDGHYRISQCTIVDNLTYDGIIHVFGPSTIFENTIIAFNPEIALMCSGTASIDVTCCNVFGNAANWSFCLEGFEYINDNMCEDPLFCDLATLDLTLNAGRARSVSTTPSRSHRARPSGWQPPVADTGATLERRLRLPTRRA